MTLQHVRRHPKLMDRTQGQKDARKWKEKDLKGFMTKFADLERAALARRADGRRLSDAPAPVTDNESENGRLIAVGRLESSYAGSRARLTHSSRPLHLRSE